MCQSLTRQKEEGQAIVLVVLAMGIFLLGAVGFGFDGSHLYSQRQMAQTAADAAAQAAMMSVYNRTNTSGAAAFATSATITCTTTDAKTPCKYTRLNGFGGTASDTVTVSFPSSAAAPGVQLSGTDPTNLIEVDVSRSVPTTFMRLLGATATTVTAKAIAAIVDISSPIPIVILHPNLSGALADNGSIGVTICGGPGRSIQVNSTSSTAITVSGVSGTIDLSKAGPKDTNGTCTTGTGADFGVRGGPNSVPFTFLTGTKPGRYLPGASIIADPLLGVDPPKASDVANYPPGTFVHIIAGNAGTGTSSWFTCPSSTAPKGCNLFSPGKYTSAISGSSGDNLYFRPGIYYIQNGGLTITSGASATMASGAPADSAIIPGGTGGTGTGWDGTPDGGGMMVYMTGTGQFQLTGSIDLLGSPSTSSYSGILLFEDRSAAANTSATHPSTAHVIGGSGSMKLRGTIYLTNSPAAGSTHYQELDLQGGPGSSTTVEGEIIVDAMGLGGSGQITMNLNSLPSYTIREVALVQ